MRNKQWFFYNKAGGGAPAFYHAFSCMDGPVTQMFIQAHLELVRRLLAYLRGRD